MLGENLDLSKKRALAIQELIDTERTFQGNMTLFKEGNRMRGLIQAGLKNELISEDERSVLKMIELLAEKASKMADLSEKLLIALEKEDPFSDETSEAMLRLIKEFKTYSQIRQIAIKEFAGVMKEKGKDSVLDKLEKQAKDAKGSLSGIGGLFIMPIQRAMRYPMLLEPILIYTGGNEHAKVERIKEKVTNAAKDYNDAMRFVDNELVKTPGVEVSIKTKRIEVELNRLPEGWTFEKKDKEKNFLKTIVDFFDPREKWVVKNEKEEIVFNLHFRSGLVKIVEEEGPVVARDEYLNRLKVLHTLTSQITTTSPQKTHYVQLKPRKGDLGTVSYLNELGAQDSAVFYKLSRKDEKAMRATLKKGVVKQKDVQEHGILTIELKNEDPVGRIDTIIKANLIPYSHKRLNKNDESIKIRNTIHPLIAIRQYEGALNAGFNPQLKSRALTEVNRYLKRLLKTNSVEKQIRITADSEAQDKVAEGGFVLKKIKKATRDGFVVEVTPDAKEALRAYLERLDAPYKKAHYTLKRGFGSHGIKNLLELGLRPKIEKKFSWWGEVLQLFGLRKETLLDKLVDKLKMTEDEIQQNITVNSGNKDLDNHINKLLGKTAKEEKKEAPQKQPAPNLNESSVLSFGQGHLSQKSQLPSDTTPQNKPASSVKSKITH